MNTKIYQMVVNAKKSTMQQKAAFAESVVGGFAYTDLSAGEFSAWCTTAFLSQKNSVMKIRGIVYALEHYYTNRQTSVIESMISTLHYHSPRTCNRVIEMLQQCLILVVNKKIDDSSVVLEFLLKTIRHIRSNGCTSMAGGLNPVKSETARVVVQENGTLVRIADKLTR